MFFLCLKNVIGFIEEAFNRTELCCLYGYINIYIYHIYDKVLTYTVSVFKDRALTQEKVEFIFYKIMLSQTFQIIPFLLWKYWSHTEPFERYNSGKII